MEHQLKLLIKSVPELIETAEACRSAGLPNFYIAGGAITQLIWNSVLGVESLDKVKDFDIVYFDYVETYTQECYEKDISSQLSHTVKIDIKNQANVHKWYPVKCGLKIQSYDRVEQGIDSWLSAFAIGFTLDRSGCLSIYAPYGLEDAFNMYVKPNKIAMTETSYIKMSKSFKDRWPSITVEPWT
ncbi:hypothetical protein AKG98_1357 [Moritella sp. JT01]|uniref:nucleotidyltransferase family protein n=1 Tax=Moritella sp. JT01 TaxID=756698 RepID=UPI0007969EAF|nr:nucleotidyltransferase family protein [Moritella sp. JT01]KXO09148.1 hypothetical protein AKG98_1357 [Moritella sp. JT01]